MSFSYIYPLSQRSNERTTCYRSKKSFLPKLCRLEKYTLARIRKTTFWHIKMNMFQYNQVSRIHNKNFDHPIIKLIEPIIIPIFKSSNSLSSFIKIDTTFRVQIIMRKKIHYTCNPLNIGLTYLIFT